MCECCSHHAAHHQGHVHINSIDCDSCFADLEKTLQEIPGIVSVEFVKETEQAKVVFDKRLVEVTALEDLLDRNGFAVS